MKEPVREDMVDDYIDVVLKLFKANQFVTHQHFLISQLRSAIGHEGQILQRMIGHDLLELKQGSDFGFSSNHHFILTTRGKEVLKAGWLNTIHPERLLSKQKIEKALLPAHLQLQVREMEENAAREDERSKTDNRRYRINLLLSIIAIIISLIALYQSYVTASK